MQPDIYDMEPLRVQGTIPVFSITNEYTDNYEQISQDHLQALKQHGINPFISEDAWVEMEDSTARIIEQYIQPSDVILDVGVGLGRLLARFPNLQRYGMDISFSYLEQAQAKGIDVCYALIENIPYKKEMFDVIVCTDVLEHVLDLNLACTKILSVLKKGGVLIIRVPNEEDLKPYIFSSIPYKYVHLRRFDLYSLRLLFEKILNCEYLTASTTGYRHLKVQLPIPKSSGIVRRLLYPVKWVSASLHRSLMRFLYVPAEINIVIRK